MLLSKPSFTRAQAGQPVTAQAWNDVLAGVEGLYDAYGTIGTAYVPLNVTFRQGPVPDARVVGVPLSASGAPAGPPVQAAPDGGDGTGFQLQVRAAGRWRIHVEAPGFAAWVREVDITPSPGTAGLAAVDAELVPTEVFVPDLVGCTDDIARAYLSWAGLGRGVNADARGTSHSDGVVVAQGPAPGTAVPVGLRGAYSRPLAAVHRLVSTAVGAAPRWMIVPNLIGALETELMERLRQLGLVLGERKILATSGTDDWIRVVGQSPPPGEVCPPGTPIDLTFRRTAGLRDVAFKIFPGTHRLLAEEQVNPIAVKLDIFGTGPLGDVINLAAEDSESVSFLTAPWDVARRGLGESEVDHIRTFCDEIGAPVGDRPDDGLAAAWESLRVAAVVGF